MRVPGVQEAANAGTTGILWPMPSTYKRAHRTHALAQRAGESYPHVSPGQALDRSQAGRLFDLYRDLCGRVPDPVERAGILGVSPEIQAAWERGAALPLLRAHRRAIEHAVRERWSG
jgi:hypothetical protein